MIAAALVAGDRAVRIAQRVGGVGHRRRAVAAVVAGGALLDMPADQFARRSGQLAVPAVEQQVEPGAAAPPGARHEQGAERRLQLVARAVPGARGCEHLRRAARGHRAHARVTSMEDLIAETPADDIEGVGIKLALYVYISGIDPETADSAVEQVFALAREARASPRAPAGSTAPGPSVFL